ncbi:MAG: homocysteine S-methyltransferase family protein, partial [Vicinamibacterales bacterium]|nr:homocysteine S-methyltransferase family protein [Vicinamibacterales bacterium]
NQSFEALNVTRPELVLKVHRAYVEAGADVIETNTFGANRVKLAGFGLADQLAEINVTGARLARQAVGVSGYVAGSVGPRGAPGGGGGATTAEAAESQFTEQVAALLEGGVDLLLLETFGEIVELEAAVRAVRRLSDLPLVAQVATGEDGLSLDGVTPEQFAGTLSALGATMVGVNCGAGPAATLETVERIAAATDVPLSAQPNAGGPKEVEGRRLVLSSPEFLASYARRYVAAGAGLVGGCCGTTPAHIARIKLAVATLPAPRPALVRPPASA